MKYLTLILFSLSIYFTSVNESMAQNKVVPNGTRRAIERPGKRGFNYYDNRGMYLGQSQPNIFGGFNYYDNRGRLFMREYKTPNGYRYGK